MRLPRHLPCIQGVTYGEIQVSDHKVTHTHRHRHERPHLDAIGHYYYEHEHEHSHTSLRESYYGDGAIHRNHFHHKEDDPRASR